jgi:hypothetical protein
MRHFIFFYKRSNNKSHQYGTCGVHSETLPKARDVFKSLANTSDFKEGDCAILSYNEVTEEDYESFFGEEEV